VILDTVITTTFVSLVALFVWRIRWYFVLPFWLTFATFEGLYMTSALNKVPDGAWFTISLAVAIALLFSIWRFGKERQWIAERKDRLSKLAKLVKYEKNDVTVLTEEFGSGEITNLKGRDERCSVSRADGHRPRTIL
jgi:KUP system potassium uptake protein